VPRRLTPSLASKFAGLALAGAGREWPHVYLHFAEGPGGILSPRDIHPAFYGCYDWHSSVHGHWTLARVLRLFPGLPASVSIRAVLDEHLTKANIESELEYFKAQRGMFERPYGWGWLLALAAELRIGGGADARRWSQALRPLETYIAGCLCSYLPRLPYPVRSGVHSNTAFALTLALDYARATGHRRLERVIVSRSRVLYGGDRDAPVAWEPSGEDFLSPSLAEADLMSRVLPASEFRLWLPRFLPALAEGKPNPLMGPPRVLNRLDGRQVHLDGLCLSRAWALDRIAPLLRKGDRVLAAADSNARAGLARVSSGDYAGEHWLASFALYLLTGG
jgi:hypothetical protein